MKTANSIPSEAAPDQFLSTVWTAAAKTDPYETNKIGHIIIRVNVEFSGAAGVRWLDLLSAI
jgi:hypothetical protein